MSNQAPVLLIDDDNDFVVLFRYAAQKAGLSSPIFSFHTCEQATGHLIAVSSCRPTDAQPALVLLDGSISGERVLDFVHWLRGRNNFQKLRLAILSGSDDIKQMDAAYKAGIDAYIIKPVELSELIGVIGSVSRFWLR